MSILAILCFLVAIVLFVLAALFEPYNSRLVAIGLAFFAAGTGFALGLHL